MKADVLLEKMKGMKYGWYDHNNDKIITPDDKEFGIMDYFENNCFVLKPDEVWKRRVGTCWDFAILEYTELKKSYDEVIPMYFEILKNKRLITHSFVIYKDELNVYRWFEYAWEKFSGINGPYSDRPATGTNIIECAMTQYKATERDVQILCNFKVEPLLKLENITAEEFIYNAHNSYRPEWLKDKR